MDYEILIAGEPLKTVESVHIKKSVETLADTARIVLPGV